MAQQERDGFVMQLKQTAAERKIPIDRLSCRDLPDKDSFEFERGAQYPDCRKHRHSRA